MKSWLAHKELIRRFNVSMIVLLVIGLIGAWSVGGLRLLGIIFLVEIVFGGILISMANVMLLLATPSINASDEEIRARALVGPRWLKHLITKLDNQP